MLALLRVSGGDYRLIRESKTQRRLVFKARVCRQVVSSYLEVVDQMLRRYFLPHLQ